MTDAAPPSIPAPRVGLATWPRFLASFWGLAGPYWRSPQKWKAWGLTGALLMLTVAQVGVAIALNFWNEHFFNALEQRQFDRFYLLIGAFAAIVLVNVATTTTHLYVKRVLQVDWRAWLTRQLIDVWMTAGRPYQLAERAGPQDNPDARIAEDVRIATEYAVDLAHVAVYSNLVLISFIGILWTISGTVSISIFGADIDVPGHMVWLAILYAGFGTWVAYLLGRPLTPAADRRQAAEADFRYGLGQARANALAIALVRGESDERQRLGNLFAAAQAAWDRQTRALRNIFYYVTSWPMLSQVVPILIAAPRYIGGSITLGTLMQSAQAFQQVSAALSWPIDSMAKAADWRASVERVRDLAMAAAQADAPHAGDNGRIAIETGTAPALSWNNLSIDERDGHTAVAPLTLRVEPGQRLLIAGEAGATGKLFRATAGLWPWGRGQIVLPSDGPVFFMPEHPYVPAGPLGAVVCYPSVPEGCGPAEIRAALGAVGLAHLAGDLDRQAQWDSELTASDQQRLAFARALLHKPRWLFLDHATNALDMASAREMLGLLLATGPGLAIVAIAQQAGLDTLFTRRFELRRHDGFAELREVELAGRETDLTAIAR